MSKFTAGLVIFLGLALVGGACGGGEPSPEAPSAYTQDPESSDAPEDPLAFALMLAGATNTRQNCEIAFDEIMKSPNPGYEEWERASAVSDCAAA